MKHTKGEWIVQLVGEVHNPKYITIVSNLPNGGRQHICSTNYDKEWNVEYIEALDANAKIIAAAPDMLKVLNMAMSLIIKSDNEELIIEYKKAIKRAIE